MNINFTFKNFEASEHLKKYARRRFEKLSRFLGKTEQIEMGVILSVEKFRHKIEAQITGPTTNISGMEQTEDMYSTIDMLLDKLEAQVKKQGERLRENRRTAGQNKAITMEVFNYAPGARNDERQITESDSFFNRKPIFADEAAILMEERGFDFLTFINAENERINVVFRRKKGGFGLIDPGV